MIIASAAGCSGGGGGQPLPSGLKPEPGTPSLPDPAEEALPESSSEEEVVGTVLRFAMEKSVLEQAAIDRPISSECTAATDREYDCTVTFDGKPVHHKIDVHDVSEPNSFTGQRVTFDVVEQDFVVTRHAVQLEMAHTMESSAKNGNGYVEPTCEEFAEVQVVSTSDELESPNCFAKSDEWPHLSEKFHVTPGSTGVGLFHH